MNDLRKFCYQNPCPKCGKEEAEVQWTARYWIPGTDEQTSGVLTRTCTRCEYTWNELPLDTEETA